MRVVAIEDGLHLGLKANVLVFDVQSDYQKVESARSLFGMVADCVELPTRSFPQPLATRLALGLPT